METPRDPETSDAQEAEEDSVPQSVTSAAEDGAEGALQVTVSHNPNI